MPQVVLGAFHPHRSEWARAGLVAVAMVASILALAVLSTGNYQPLLIVGAVAGVSLALWSIPYTTRHGEWLIFVIALTYLVISISLLSEQARGFLHYGVLLVFCLPVIARPYRSGLFKEGNFRLYCFYFAWALATACYSLAPTFSAGRWLGAVLGFCAVMACVVDVREKQDSDRLIAGFFIACAVMTIATLLAAAMLPGNITWQTPADGLDPQALMRLQQQGVSLTGMDRFRGIFGNANDVGSLMLITVSAAAICWERAKKYQRVLLAFVVVAAIALAVEADSRSPFVGLVVGTGLFVIWRYRFRGAVALALMLAVALGTVLALGGVSYLTRGNIDTLTGRTDMWAYVIEKIRERPLLGYGYEVSGAIFNSRYFPLWYGPWDEGPHSSLHNGYFTHFVGVGIPATLLWLYIAVRPWVFIFRQKHDPWNLKMMGMLVVIPLLIYNLTEAGLGDFMGQTGFLFGLAWAIAERYRILEIGRTAEQRQRVLESMSPAVRALQN